AAGAKNVSLTKYLVQQLMLSKEQRMEEVRKFIPNAKSEDWDSVVAGQRVQVIKDTPEGKGTLQFGTELVDDKDGTVAALLGASADASTAVQVMLDLVQQCFPERIEEGEPKVKEMSRYNGKKLVNDVELRRDIQSATNDVLGLNQILPV